MSLCSMRFMNVGEIKVLKLVIFLGATECQWLEAMPAAATF